MCGACCEYMIVPLDPRMLQSPRLADWIKWAELHGCKVLVDSERGWFDLCIPQVCGELRYDARCNLIVEDRLDERPEMCARYPQSEADLVGVEHVCSYRFEPLTEEASDDQGA